MVNLVPEITTDLSEMDLVDDLERALQVGEMRLHYQPQVSLTGYRTIGVEALIRWEHPRLGLLMPGQFLPCAELAGLGRQVTEFVLPSAIGDLVKWSRLGWNISVSVNISAEDLADNGVVDLVFQQVKRLPVPHHRLTLEVTEHSAIHDMRRSSDVLDAFRQAGARTSLDDFGTGYSSLSSLSMLPLDEIKIDREFLAANRDTDGYLIRSVAEIGQHLGLRVIGEGAETLADVEILRVAGVEVIQGYWFSRPVPRLQVASSYSGDCPGSGQPCSTDTDDERSELPPLQSDPNL
jgi:EAL domain-containing protein (putative c-di-GMP-specific phosphodiesterase class I)